MPSWVDSNGSVYEGDMRPGDRAATDAEVAAWQATHRPLPASVHIVSSGTPAISGYYSTDPSQVALFVAQEASILGTGKFTNGETTLLWLDNGVTFPDTASFVAIATAYAAWVTSATLSLASGADFPAQPVNIP